MSWAEIKHALNNTLGTSKFKPLNKMIAPISFRLPLTIDNSIVNGTISNKTFATRLVEVNKEEIYILGGMYRSSGINYINPYVYKYNAVTNTITTKASMINARWEFDPILYNKKIYCFGGGNSSGGLIKKTNIYDIDNNSWSNKDDPIDFTSRKQHVGVGINDKMYFMGGVTANNTRSIDSNEMYDPVTDTWQTMNPIPETKARCGHAVLGNYIYLFGGYTGNGVTTYSAFKYNTINDTWTKISSPNVPIIYNKGMVYNGKIYVLGSSSLNTTMNSMYVYDPDIDEWYTIGNVLPYTTDQYESSSMLMLDEKNGKFLMFGGRLGNSYTYSEYYFTANMGCKLVPVVKGGTIYTNVSGLRINERIIVPSLTWYTVPEDGYLISENKTYDKNTYIHLSMNDI